MRQLHEEAAQRCLARAKRLRKPSAFMWSGEWLAVCANGDFGHNEDLGEAVRHALTPRRRAPEHSGPDNWRAGMLTTRI